MMLLIMVWRNEKRYRGKGYILCGVGAEKDVGGSKVAYLLVGCFKTIN